MFGHAAEFFRGVKASEFILRNDSVCKKCVLAACGIIPFEEIACGQQMEFFRFKELHQFDVRNNFI